MLNRRIVFRLHWLTMSLAVLCLISTAAAPLLQQQMPPPHSGVLKGQIKSVGQTKITVSRMTAKLYFPKEANRAALLTYSDASGNFKFGNLPPGKFLLEVYSGNALLYQTEVSLAGSSAYVEIPIGRTDTGKIVIQYFPKVFDQAQLEGALQKLGGKYIISRGKPEIGDTPTNAIFYGSDVSVDDVKSVARALADAGIKIRTIKKFKTSTSAKARTIQIGSDRAAASAPVWDHNRINNATSLDR